MTTRTYTASRFHIGQRVKAVAFTDCFGKFIPERDGLTVTSIRLIEPTVARDTMKPYYRITAHDDSGFGYIEAAERFFDATH